MKKSAAASAELKNTTKYKIAEEVNMHPNTLTRKLRQKGIEAPRGLISPDQRKMILTALGFSDLV